jgi:hypothetical protein
MSTTYTPTSNWTDRDLKGRDLQAKPLRPSEPVSFSSDPATERLSRRMAQDVRPVRDAPATDLMADDDFMNRPMVNESDARAAHDGPDIFDAPMVNVVSADSASDSSVLEAPMADTRQTMASAPTPRAELPDAAIAPTYGASPRRRGLSPMVMVGAPLGVAAVAAIGWLALSGGETAAPPVEATQPLEISAAAPAADPLINMPVSETGAPIASVDLAPAAVSTPTPRPARAAPSRPEPVRAEPAVAAQTAPETAITAPVEPAAPAISPEPVSASEPAVETPAPLIATEPLSPQ